MSFEMNMLYSAHLLGTEMEGKNLQTYLKAHLNMLTQLLLYSKHRMSSIKGKIMQFSAVAKKGHFCYMTEIETEAVGFPVICQLVGGEFI